MAGSALKKIWARPTFIILSEKEPLQDGTTWDFQGGDVLYLTDDNRSEVQFSPQRIESKRRMIDGTMRSYFTADKNTISTSWSNIPSRAIDGSRTYISEYDRTSETSGFGAGIDIKDWHEAYTKDFWALMVYDISKDSAVAGQAEKYHVFFETFDYTISKRGQFNDLWNVSISLVEV